MTLTEAEEMCKTVLSNVDKAAFDRGSGIDSLLSSLSELDDKIAWYYGTKAKLMKRYAEVKVPGGDTIADVICKADSLEHRIAILRKVLGVLDANADVSIISSVVKFIQEYTDMRHSLLRTMRDVCDNIVL